MDMSAQLSDSQYTESICSASPSHFESSSLCDCNHDHECSAHQESVDAIQRECLSDCVCELMFADISATSGDSSFSLDSGYTSLPDPDSISIGSSNCNSSANTLDSDATDFVEEPLPIHRPVTHKTMDHRTIAKQLKRVSKQIHRHGINNCMNTLAVL